MPDLTSNSSSLLSCPTEILSCIVSHLFLEDIANLSIVNKLFYTVFDPLLYYQDAKPYNRYAIYWAAVNASIVVAKRALDAGTPVNDRSNASIEGEKRIVISGYCVNLSVQQSFRSANMTTLIAFLLREGANMTPPITTITNWSERDKALSKLRISPFGHALAVMPDVYLITVQQHYQEVSQLGEFSSTALAKLAVASGNVEYAREVLKPETLESGFWEKNRNDLLQIAKALDDTAMTAMITEALTNTALETDTTVTIKPDSHGRYRESDLLEFVKFMLKDGADICDVNTHEWWELERFHSADYALERCYRILNELSDGLPTSISLQRLAYVLGNMDLVDICVQYWDEGNSPETLLMMMECACSWGDSRWAKILVDRGADVRTSNPSGDHPNDLLYRAAETLDPTLIKLLLDHGAQAAGNPKDGKRSLIAKVIMCGRGNKKNIVPILVMLLEAGASTDRVFADLDAGYSPYGQRVPHRTWERDHDELTPDFGKRRSFLEEICQPGCLELLESHGVIIYRPDQCYLYGALNENNMPLLERLLRDRILEADLPRIESGLIPPRQIFSNYSNERRQALTHTMIHLKDDVSGVSTLNLMKCLLKHGATINDSMHGLVARASSYYEENPAGTLRVIEFLLEMGAPTAGPGNRLVAAIPAVPGTDLKLQRFLLGHNLDLDIPNDQGVTALEALCKRSTHKDWRVLDLYLNHDPSLATNAALMAKVAAAATKARNIPMLRTVLRRTFIEPQRILGWALYVKSNGPQELDERTVAFAVAMGGLQDAASVGTRLVQDVSLLEAILFGNEDIVMTALHWYRYCTQKLSFPDSKKAIEVARGKHMERAVAYLEQHPHCTSRRCSEHHSY